MVEGWFVYVPPGMVVCLWCLVVCCICGGV